jgi:hypothetical protein
MTTEGTFNLQPRMLFMNLCGHSLIISIGIQGEVAGRWDLPISFLLCHGGPTISLLRAMNSFPIIPNRKQTLLALSSETTSQMSL